MKLLEFVTPSRTIYHGLYTQKMFWEEKFTLVNMTSFGRHNFRKHIGIKNGKQYIILDISSKIDCPYKR